MSHKDVKYVNKLFKQAGRTLHNNPAQCTSATGNHGGELFAAKSFVFTIVVPRAIFDFIARETGTPCRFAACIVRVKSVSYLLVTLYWKCNVGIQDNYCRFEQLRLLVKYFNLPFIAIGDYNCTPEEVVESGWLNLHLDAMVRVPTVSRDDPTFAATSLLNKTDRMIDFVLHSRCLDGLIHKLYLIREGFATHFPLS